MLVLGDLSLLASALAGKFLQEGVELHPPHDGFLSHASLFAFSWYPLGHDRAQAAGSDQVLPFHSISTFTCSYVPILSSHVLQGAGFLLGLHTSSAVAEVVTVSGFSKFVHDSELSPAVPS